MNWAGWLSIGFIAGTWAGILIMCVMYVAKKCDEQEGGRVVKEAELRKHCTCSLCGKKVGETGLPLFWRLTVDRFGVDMRAVQRQTGLAMMLGSPVLAGVMGPDEDMAKPVMQPVVLTICETCAVERSLPAAALAEVGRP